MNCKTIQVDVGIVSGHFGECTDTNGNKYADVGAGLGIGIGVYRFSGQEPDRSDIDSFGSELRGNLGLIGAVRTGTVNTQFGWGLGGGFGVTLRGLVPKSLGAR